MSAEVPGGEGGACRPDPFRGEGHRVIINGACETCGGRRETDEEYRGRVFGYTGRQAWMEAEGPSEGTFGDRAVPETLWMHLAPVGLQSGTYFKTARQYDGMTVWRWGGRDGAAADSDAEMSP